MFALYTGNFFLSGLNIFLKIQGGSLYQKLAYTPDSAFFLDIVSKAYHASDINIAEGSSVLGTAAFKPFAIE